MSCSVAPPSLDRGSDHATAPALDSPTMLLQGHKSDILSLKFSPNTGEFLASASRDSQIFIWKALGPCHHVGLLRGHKNAITQVCWSDDALQLFSASCDRTLGCWDVETSCRLVRFVGHGSYVNALAVAPDSWPGIASASDDGCVLLWDPRRRHAVGELRRRSPQTAVALHGERRLLFASDLENDILVWDVRQTDAPALVLRGHTDTVSSLAIGPHASFLLSNAMDHTLKIWDVRSYAPGNRLVKTLYGASHGPDPLLLRGNWSADGARVAAGSYDRHVFVWDVPTSGLLYRLPGHAGPVTEVDFHPLAKQVIASGGLDGIIFVGELDAPV